MGRGLCFAGTCFGSFAELARPHVSRAACQITTEGLWEWGGRRGGGQGSLDKLAHTRQMFAQKNTVKSSCKYNRESASSHHWLLGLLAFLFCQSGLRRGWGAGFGEPGEVCSAHPCWPPPLHSPGEQSFPCKRHPQSEPRAWSVPQVGVRGAGLSPEVPSPSTVLPQILPERHYSFPVRMPPAVQVWSPPSNHPHPTVTLPKSQETQLGDRPKAGGWGEPSGLHPRLRWVRHQGAHWQVGKATVSPPPTGPPPIHRGRDGRLQPLSTLTVIKTPRSQEPRPTPLQRPRKPLALEKGSHPLWPCPLSPPSTTHTERENPQEANGPNCQALGCHGNRGWPGTGGAPGIQPAPSQQG